MWFLMIWHLAYMPLAPITTKTIIAVSTDFIGYRTEGYALSNGIRAVISRPRFSDAAFDVGEEDARGALCIKY